MPQAGNYNSSSIGINVDQMSLWNYGKTDIPSIMEMLVASVDRIHTAWNGLKLGWAGTTADEAQDFNERWNAALAELFGSKEHPGQSVLSKIAVAVQTAAMNYAVAEHGVLKMFDSFYSSIIEPGGTVQPPVRDENQGPITENAQW